MTVDETFEALDILAIAHELLIAYADTESQRKLRKRVRQTAEDIDKLASIIINDYNSKGE